MTSVDLLFLHSATVEPFLGSGPTGPSYGPPVVLSGLLDDGLMQVAMTNGFGSTSGGSQLVSKTTFYTALENIGSLPVGSRLTCNERSMTVTGTRRRDGSWLMAAASHLEVDCE